MKILKNKKIVLTLLCFFFAVSVALAVIPTGGVKSAYAFESYEQEFAKGNDFYMKGGSIRIDADWQGLRFKAIVSPEKAREVIENKTKSFGAFIIPVDYMIYDNVATDYNESVDYYKEISKKRQNIINFDDIKPYEVKNSNGEIIYYEIRATISRVLYANTARTFFGLSYIKTEATVEGGEASYEYARFENNNKRSIAYVASAALLDPDGGYTADQKNILNNILQLSLYSMNGVEESVARQNVENKAFYDYEAELNKNNVVLKNGEEFAVTAHLKYKSAGSVEYENYFKKCPLCVTYAVTSGEEFVSVNGNVITAIAEGEAVVTGSYVGLDNDGKIVVKTKTVNVTVTSSSLTEYKSITAYKNHEQVSAVGFSVNDKAITTEVLNNCNGITHAQGIQVDGMEGNSEIYFRITNNHDSAIKIAVWSSKEFNNTYANSASVNGVACEGGEKQNVSGKDAYVVEVPANNSIYVRFAVTEAFTNTSDVRFSPYMSNGNNAIVGATFTLSEFSYVAGGESSVDLGKAVVVEQGILNGKVVADSARALVGEKVYLTVTPDKGYKLENLSINNGEISYNDYYVFIMPDADVTITATFVAIDYNVTVANGVKAKIRIADNYVTTAQYGNQVIIVSTEEKTEIVAFEYRIKGAVSTGSIKGNSFIMPTADVEIVGITTVTGNRITVNGGTADFGFAPNGTTVTVRATIPEHKRFVSWTVSSGGIDLADAAASETTFVMGDADVELTANYEDITVTVVIEGTETVYHGKFGDSISISAGVAEEGYEFSKWVLVSGRAVFTNENSSETTLRITGDEDVRIKAIFTEIVTEEGLTIAEAGKNDSNVNFISNTTVSATFESLHGISGQEYHYGWTKFVAPSDISSIRFKLYNNADGNSNNVLNMYVAVKSSINGAYYNGAFSIAEVINGSVDGNNKAKLNSLQKGESGEFVITLSQTINSGETFYVTFAPMIDNGGFIGKFTVEFGEEKKYDVICELEGVTIDATQYSQGEKVVINSVDPSKIVTGFTYSVDGEEITVTGNYFIMPAKSVTIVSVTVEVKPEITATEISEVGKGQGTSHITASLAEDKYSATYTGDWGWSGNGQNAHYAYAKLTGVSGTTIKFTITNNASGNNSSLNLKITLASSLSYNYNDNALAVLNENEGGKVAISTIESGGSVEVTITLASEVNGDLYLLLNPYDNSFGNGFVGDFVISDVSVS